MDRPGLFELVAELLDVTAGPKIDLRPSLLKEWDKIAPLFRSLREDKRDKIHVADLNLKDGMEGWGVQNILNVYRQTSPEERDFWGKWYIGAHDVVSKLADKYDIPMDVAAGVVAVLSPGNRWWINVRIADKLMLFWSNDAIDILGPLSAYPDSLGKALMILNGADPVDVVHGPKVEVFYDSLIDPEGLRRSIVLDGHALNIWSGRKVSLKEAIKPSDDLRDEIEDDYREAAARLRISPQALQATTWYVWRFVTDPNNVKPRKGKKNDENEDEHDEDQFA